MINTYIYRTPVTVIKTRVYTRYLQLGMKKYTHLYSYLNFCSIFPIYNEVFSCCSIERFCRGLEKVLRMRKRTRPSLFVYYGAHVYIRSEPYVSRMDYRSPEELLAMINLITVIPRKQRQYVQPYSESNELENQNTMKKGIINRGRSRGGYIGNQKG